MKNIVYAHETAGKMPALRKESHARLLHAQFDAQDF